MVAHEEKKDRRLKGRGRGLSEDSALRSGYLHYHLKLESDEAWNQKSVDFYTKKKVNQQGTPNMKRPSNKFAIFTANFFPLAVHKPALLNHHGPSHLLSWRD